MNYSQIMSPRPLLPRKVGVMTPPTQLLWKRRPWQELSYPKQIARQLRTQYVEGIYDNPVTLKSRLTVTQGHWKRNHWVDHTRLTVSRVIGRWILSWPWNVSRGHSRSLKLVPFKSLDYTVSYSPSIVTMAVSVAVCEIFAPKPTYNVLVRGGGQRLSAKM